MKMSAFELAKTNSRPVAQEPIAYEAPVGTQSIHRAIELVRLIAANNDRGIRLVDIAKLATLQRSTCHRILRCLVHEGMAAERQPGNRYVLGPLAYEVGLGAAKRYRIEAISHPFLLELAESTEDAVFLSVRSDLHLSCVDYAIGSYPIKAYTRNLGDRRPLGFGCAGVAILSLLPEDAIRRIVIKNKDILATYGVTALESIVQKSLQARRDAFASHTRPTLGLRALAVPVADANGAPIGALSLCALSSRVDGERIGFLLQAMHATAKNIEAELQSHSPNLTHHKFGLSDVSVFLNQAEHPN